MVQAVQADVRRLPFNLEAERAFVGTLLVYPDELPRFRSGISADDFYAEIPRRAYEGLCAIADSGGTPSMPLLLEQSRGKLSAVQIAELARGAVMPFELDKLAEVILEDSRKRALLKLAKDIAVRAYDDEVTSSEAIAYAENALAQLQHRGAVPWVMNRDLLARHMEVLQERYSKGGVIGIPTGFADLDEHLGGLVPGNLIFLAAVPKTGKTSWALHVALNCGVPCLFFTLEMLPSELADRELSMKAKIPARNIRTGRMDDEAWKKLGTVIGPLADKPLAFVAQSGLTVADIRSICQHFKAQHGLGLIIIDQLDKIHEPRIRGENDTTRIGRVTGALKCMARDLEVPVVCLTQLLDKAIAQRAVPRPQHGDIRDSSYPDQDADVVLYLWRPGLYWPEEKAWQNLVEIIIARSRATAEGSVWVRWQPEFTLFQALERASWPKGEYTRKGAKEASGRGRRRGISAAAGSDGDGGEETERRAGNPRSAAE